MMEKLAKKHAEKIRFAIVGGTNTALDFSILFLLVLLGVDKITGNYISTSIALIFSFFANKKFTFKTNNKSDYLDIIKFMIITLFGLWVIQPVIINMIEISTNPAHLDQFVVLFMGKCLATVVTLIWNYLLYRKFVFTK